jgi:hypothetical protein
VVHSSHTTRRCPPARKVLACSPRNRRLPHTSHATSGREVTIVLAAIEVMERKPRGPAAAAHR